MYYLSFAKDRIEFKGKTFPVFVETTIRSILVLQHLHFHDNLYRL
jgi:hypothetical protein